ncbi:MAG: hypothetical protein KY444_09185 [Gemmatimonadetes bacterium]|nr:hypothetical protein [Gemmatimonadota bacterium]
MDEQKRGPGDLPTSERMATLAGAMTNAMGHKAHGEHETQHGAALSVPLAEAERIIASWPAAPQKGARQMLEQYGPPNEATPTKLFWYQRGPWKRIQVTSDVVTHDFPAPHSDYLTQWIDYKVPVGLVSELTRYDGSCLIDRTAGEAAARCDSEAANTITLNLMHEIVTGKRTVEEARAVYAENMAGYTVGRPAPYAERLLFPVPQGGTEDPDEGMGMSPMIKQAAGKVKDVLTGHEHEPTDR